MSDSDFPEDMNRAQPAPKGVNAPFRDVLADLDAHDPVHPTEMQLDPGIRRYVLILRANEVPKGHTPMCLKCFGLLVAISATTKTVKP